VFSYGTYQDYVTSNLPSLNEDQIRKLRQLSLLTLAKSPSTLSYDNLLPALGLSTARELEDVVISAIYAGLLSGTLDPYNRLVIVAAVSPLRDLEPNSVPNMLSTLNEWSARCNSTLADLEKQITSVKVEAQRRHREEQEWAAHVEKLVEEKKKDRKGDGEDQGGGSFSNTGRRLGAGAALKRGNGMLGKGADDADDMDVDDQDDDGSSSERKGSRSAKKRGFFDK